tara:strand:+ start:142 stop:1377 length:1236 start_codon:yes stop_codon:yes gene_type:complete
MVDLHTANALAVVAAETGAGIAMVGDHLQAMPVGHAGAMACMTRRATGVVELTAVHRFRDPEYAALTLRMREPASREDAVAVAYDLDARGSIHRVRDATQARDVMVEAWFRWSAVRKRVALVTGTNDEADAINETIQERRVQLGQLRQDRLAIGQGEQRLLEGDVVQTRLNDRAADVENRALWTIRRIGNSDIELAALGDSGDVRRVSLAYAAEHVHLAYASTVHGIQGETTDASIVGPGVDASGLYVGMTRGRVLNEAIAVAWTREAARERVADSMMRGVQEISIEDAMRAARAELGRAARPLQAGLPSAEVGELVGAGADADRDWLMTAGKVLLALDSQIANARAERQGRGGAEADEAKELIDQRQRLTERIAAVEASFARPVVATRNAIAPSRSAVDLSPTTPSLGRL